VVILELIRAIGLRPRRGVESLRGKGAFIRPKTGWTRVREFLMQGFVCGLVMKAHHPFFFSSPSMPLRLCGDSG
jgi:hypothetical protein